MHFDQRTQAALREVGLDTDEIQDASALVTTAVEETAAELEAFFDATDHVYSDMDMAHAATATPEHAVDYCDLSTHAADMRGWLRFDSWGVYVEDGRVLERERPDANDATTGEADDPRVVELSLGPTIHERVRFATTREALE